MNRLQSGQSKNRSGTGLGSLLILLLLLAGCALGGNERLHQTADTPNSTDGPTVTRFKEGRIGFVLTESVTLDAGLRRDFDQAVAFINKRDFNAAIELLLKLVEISPEVTAPHINLALAYVKVGKPEPAEEQLKIALNLVPGHPVASAEYGLLLRKAGRFVEARTVYEQALTGFPEYLPVRRNLGILCDLYLNDPECALAEYEQYLETAPGDKQISLWISELRLRTGL